MILGLSACVDVMDTPVSTPIPTPATPLAPSIQITPNNASNTVADFVAVVAQMEPIAERECRQRRPNANCDFRIVVDRDPSAPSNAWQSLDDSGRPLITFTVALISEVKNRDELAFVLGHEAAHHISGHISKTVKSTRTGALIGGVFAAALGADQATVETAFDLGAIVGARRFSKGYELQADQLSTIITYHAGYNPVRGAAYFTRIPDPGDQFLGSHPPNAQRIETVRRTMATL